MADSFVHLHNHSEYSMLDGAAKTKAMAEEAARLGQPAIGLTDHGYLFGAYDFYQNCVKAGVKPIIGLEAYVTPGTSRFDRQKVLWGEPWQRSDDVSAGGSYNHLTLIAYNTTGMHNLFRLGSYASTDGQFGKWPRADKELLSQFHEGLIVFTGCPSGAVQTRLRLGQWDEAVREAGELRDIFGEENFYVEIMDHGIEFERRTQKQLLELAELMKAPLVATNDAHYVKQEDRKIQDALLCINSGSRINDPDRFKFDGDGYYIRSSEEMRDIWKELPQACNSTLEIAERCDISFTTTNEGANYMPAFDVPEGEDETSWFIKEVEKGLNYRFPQGIPDDVRKQAEYESDVIVQMGFPGYFLTVADYINWAKEQKIRVGPGRGSGAGSMVAYAMRITELNPLEHGLIFERFLNPERISMPDFDVDFDERRRDEVIEYVKCKYGEDRISQVVTYGTIKTKQALKDSARILGKDFKVGEQLTKALPPAIMGKDISVHGIFDENDKRYAEAAEFRKYYEENKAETQEVVDYALGLEGLTRQWGVHACAVIMSSHTLTDIIPVMKRPQDGAIITQFDYPTCETLGLLKMDFLGLRNLTVISDALENIAFNGKQDPDLEHLDTTDRKTYDLLSRGDTLGVFQLDGGGMRDLLKLMKPDNFEDISAVGALYRPGPMGANSHTNYALRKNGKQEITPIHPELAEPLEEILGTTYGLIVYQEQVMQIAQKLAGYSLGQADILRKAMGKKKKEVLDEQFVGFEQGMLANGYSKESIRALWDVVVPFSAYAFNKAHSAAYGLVSYWTAYLKANFPTEYMAALLTSTKDNKDKRALYLAECRHMDITVLQPDVNHSMGNFAPDGESIRFGLNAIQNVGANVVEAIVQTRQEKGKFASFQDFLDKVPQVVCNKRTIQSLIKAGAFDSMGHTRRAMLARCDEAVDAIIDVKRNEAIGQFDLFGGLGEDMGTGGTATLTVDIPDIPEFERKQKLAQEREMLGLYVSDHPLRGVEASLARYQDVEITQVINSEDGMADRVVKIAGLVSSVQTKVTKQGNAWAIATIEDLTGSVEVLFFPRSYETIQSYLSQDIIVQVEGKVNVREEGMSVYGQSMTLLDLSDGADLPLDIQLPTARCTPELLTELRGVLESFPGGSPVRLHLREPGRTTVVELDPKLRVAQSSAFFSHVKAVVGLDGIISQ